MRAVDAVMECLKAEGVEVVFGYPGGANLPTYDAFYDAGIHHVLVRHEAGGGHAAEGYAKVTGKVGVSLGTSGPGATNLVTAIQDAMMDSVPVVFLTGQVRTDLLGTDGFQEADVIGITMPSVKHSFMITDPRDIPRVIHEAFHIAGTGRPGPVLVDIPTDLSRADIDYVPVDGRPSAGLPADDRGQREADPPGRQGAGRRAPSGALRRRRRRRGERRRGARRLRAQRPVPGHLHAQRARRLPGARPAVAGHARHARDAHGELRDGRGRPDLRDRRPLRRPDHRQALRVRAAGEVHPHRHRPGRDLQEHPGAHPDRRRRQERPRAAARRVPGPGHRSGAPGGVVAAPAPVAGPAPAEVRPLAERRDHAPAADQDDREDHRGRGDPLLGRRAAPDVGGAVLRLPGAAPLDQLRRPGDDGLRPARGDRRAARRPRAADRRHQRRRLDPDEHPGAGDGPPGGPPDQDRRDEQRLPRHGPPVAGAVLERALQPRRHADARRRGGVPRLREARRRLRDPRRAPHRTRTRSRRTCGRRSRPRARRSSTCRSPARRTCTR